MAENSPDPSARVRNHLKSESRATTQKCAGNRRARFAPQINCTRGTFVEVKL
jgi:hypothetical protein